MFSAGAIEIINDTFSIGGGSYSSTKSGDDVIVTVGTGKISLIGAASLSKVNIKGTKNSTPSNEKNSWKLSGTTATYGTSSKTLVKVTGLNSLSAKAKSLLKTPATKKLLTLTPAVTKIFIWNL